MARPHLPCRVHAISQGPLALPLSVPENRKSAVSAGGKAGHSTRPVPCIYRAAGRTVLLYSQRVLLRYADAAPSPGLIPHASLRVPTYRNAALMTASHFFGSLNLPQTSACVRALMRPANGKARLA